MHLKYVVKLSHVMFQILINVEYIITYRKYSIKLNQISSKILLK